VLAQVEPFRLLLHVFPVHPQVEFLSKRQLGQLFDRFFLAFPHLRRRTHLIADIGHQAHTVVGGDVSRRRCRHDYVPTGEKIGGERALVKTIGDGRAGAEIILVEIMSGNNGGGRKGRQTRGKRGCSTGLQEITPPHKAFSRTERWKTKVPVGMRSQASDDRHLRR
jgi:hypothetical protein